MTPEQELRAVAIQAAASLCAPVSPVDRQEIPQVENVLFVADVFQGYIQGGWKQAMAVYETAARKEEAEAAPEEPVKDVELRERAVEPDILAEEAAAELPAREFVPSRETEGDPEPTQVADVIPMQARGVVTKEQSKASQYLNRIKRERAAGILKQASVAKTAEHKDRLRNEASEAGLDNFVMTINGVERSVGEYLASL